MVGCTLLNPFSGSGLAGTVFLPHGLFCISCNSLYSSLRPMCCYYGLGGLFRGKTINIVPISAEYHRSTCSKTLIKCRNIVSPVVIHQFSALSAHVSRWSLRGRFKTARSDNAPMISLVSNHYPRSRVSAKSDWVQVKRHTGLMDHVKGASSFILALWGGSTTRVKR